MPSADDIAFLSFFHNLLDFEGVQDDDPRDPGNWTGGGIGKGSLGGTKYGVSSAAYHDILNQLPEDVAKDLPVKVSNLSAAQAMLIYRLRYWRAVRADELPGALALVMADAAVNSGPVTSIRFLQRALKVDADGVFGKGTMSAVANAVRTPEDAATLVLAVLGERLRYLIGLPNFSIYGVGWSKRVVKLAFLAGGMKNDVV